MYIMKPRYESKCDCHKYDATADHRSALLKMDLPVEYEDVPVIQYSGGGGHHHVHHRHYHLTAGQIIYRALRFTYCVVTLVLLGYCLWRIRLLDSAAAAAVGFASSSGMARDHGHGGAAVQRPIASGDGEQGNLYLTDGGEGRSGGSSRIERSIAGAGGGGEGRRNSLDSDGVLPTTTTSRAQRLMESDEEEEEVDKEKRFRTLVATLFQRIEAMHNDTERSHFDRHMRAVFQAWFPVFDALLPGELTDGPAAARRGRGTAASELANEEEEGVQWQLRRTSGGEKRW